MDYVFVYGTLKRGGGLNSNLEWSRGTFICEAALKGVELYLLPAGFPAAVVDPTGEAVAIGELWRVAGLSILDQVEGHPHHYKRELRSFQTDKGIIQAWVYFYVQTVRLATALPLTTGIYPVDMEEVRDLQYEWLAYQNGNAHIGYAGIEDYRNNDEECFMYCDDCPFKSSCDYSDFLLTNE